MSCPSPKSSGSPVANLPPPSTKSSGKAMKPTRITAVPVQLPKVNTGKPKAGLIVKPTRIALNVRPSRSLPHPFIDGAIFQDGLKRILMELLHAKDVAYLSVNRQWNMIVKQELTRKAFTENELQLRAARLVNDYMLQVKQRRTGATIHSWFDVDPIVASPSGRRLVELKLARPKASLRKAAKPVSIDAAAGQKKVLIRAEWTAPKKPVAQMDLQAMHQLEALDLIIELNDEDGRASVTSEDLQRLRLPTQLLSLECKVKANELGDPSPAIVHMIEQSKLAHLLHLRLDLALHGFSLRPLLSVAHSLQIFHLQFELVMGKINGEWRQIGNRCQPNDVDGFVHDSGEGPFGIAGGNADVLCRMTELRCLTVTVCEDGEESMWMTELRHRLFKSLPRLVSLRLLDGDAFPFADAEISMLRESGYLGRCEVLEPKLIPDSQDCAFLLEMPQLKRLVLRFINVHLGDACSFAHLQRLEWLTLAIPANVAAAGNDSESGPDWPAAVLSSLTSLHTLEFAAVPPDWLTSFSQLARIGRLPRIRTLRIFCRCQLDELEPIKEFAPTLEHLMVESRRTTSPEWDLPHPDDPRYLWLSKQTTKTMNSQTKEFFRKLKTCAIEGSMVDGDKQQSGRWRW